MNENINSSLLKICEYLIDETCKAKKVLDYFQEQEVSQKLFGITFESQIK